MLSGCPGDEAITGNSSGTLLPRAVILAETATAQELPPGS